MAFTNNNIKLSSSEFPFNNSSSSSQFSLITLSRSSFNLFLSHPKSSFPTITFSSLKTTHHSSPNPTPPWLTKTTDSPKRVSESTIKEESSHFQPDKPKTPVERIVFRLRNLGLVEDDEQQQQKQEQEKEVEEAKLSALTVTGDEKLSELLKRKWVRPDVLLDDDGDEEEKMVVPWKREEEREIGGGGSGGGEIEEEGFKKRTLKAPSLADLTLEDELLRRLRREGMRVRERVNVPKAGLTQEVMEKIHERWRREELVRLKFHEELAKNMRIAHEIVEVSFFALALYVVLLTLYVVLTLQIESVFVVCI
ncbi:chloroplastic group IIA intron splicing facilitator CRS1 chloroplastic-like [Trifolium pratense]|uniref:Chloroplastic group IIA intron splicing facilitator CRS1 chloroplastic-like n=1 Tax=Trifolium pratense TaxID=57577 RepID=A0A2K3JNV8_TRIPR|nr:chloroplastic group IIA intron splicing facilitator CRS1 chloroplastic-like [Trifolium pratense]